MSFIFLVVAAVMWGATNPLIRKASVKGLHKIEEKNLMKRMFLELRWMLSRLDYVIPLFINFSGSFVFVYGLSSAAVSVAVPVTNSLAFLFSTAVSLYLGEKPGSKGTFLGLFFIMLGSAICVYSSNSNSK
eukprot:ANDGO_00109.mRNA.1 Transmembrane protein 234 homolog